MHHCFIRHEMSLHRLKQAQNGEVNNYRSDILNKIIKFADHMGMSTATVCLVHCLATPLLLSLLPMLGWLAEEETVHQYLVAFAIVAALAALLPGFLVHRRWKVIVYGGIGLASISGATFIVGPQFGEYAELFLSVIGGICLFVAHMNNRTSCAKRAMLAKQNFSLRPE